MILSNLKRNSSGQSVRYMQDLLCRHGHSLSIDGSFGPGTETIVKAFQVKNGLVVDGLVGPGTWTALSKKITTKGKVGNVPKITEDLIPITKDRRSGAAQKPDSVTIHNTANPNSTAYNERAWLLNPKNDRIASWHYAVDQNHAVLVIPEKEIAWHAGNAIGNTTSIGIEVCESGDQKLVWSNAVGLVASICIRYGWDADHVTTHNRWSGKDCPRLILDRWNEFIIDVQTTIDSIKSPIAKPITPVTPPVPTPQPVPEPKPIPPVEPIPEPKPEPIPEPIPPKPEPPKEVIPEPIVVPDPEPTPTPEPTPIPELIPEPKPIPVPETIPTQEPMKPLDAFYEFLRMVEKYIAKVLGR